MEEMKIPNTSIMCTHPTKEFIYRPRNTLHVGIKRVNTIKPYRRSEGLGLCKEDEDIPNLRSDIGTTGVKGEESQHNGPQSIYGDLF